MYILGVNATMNDSAVCLIKDGKVFSAIEEERLTRYKFEKALPKRAITYCLKQAGITLKDVDYVAYTWKPWLYLRSELCHRLSRLPVRTMESLYGLVQMDSIFTSHLNDIRNFRKSTGKDPVAVNHHLCHMASSFLVSPFERAAILSVDNRGEKATTVMALGEKNNIKVLKEIHIPHSLGKVYSGLTYHLGFRPDKDEYKVMGLASYGKPVYYDLFKKIIRLEADGGYKIDGSFCNYDIEGRPTAKLATLIGPERKYGEPVTQHHMDIAASLQKVHEEAILHLAGHLKKITGEENLCLSGGVCYNSVANGRIERESGFRNFYTPPYVGDSGTAFGAAFHVYNTLLGKERVEIVNRAYFGASYSDDEIKNALDMCKVKYEKQADITVTTARLLSEGNIMGWFQGAMEFGPRALGCRSIIADPRRAEMKDLVNKYVKRREEFRPFAPSVLEEEMPNYFDTHVPSPFMTSVCLVHPDQRAKIPAVTHFDGTARIQTVSRKTNPLYWEMINKFGKITGVPIVLNTSFNVRDEPIVCSPLDAVGCFFSSGMDYLAIGSFLVSKK
ncbi:MAG: carbamoyl transferase [Candidatus Schekmanbacteria bacterium]|nr:carbamoyl transferase [Candidatus Schekmanbacteria bacterium]